MSNQKAEQSSKIARPRVNAGTVKRVIKLLFQFFPVKMPLALLCMFFSAVVSALPALFLQQIITIAENWYTTGDWNAAKAEIIPVVTTLVCLYLLAILSTILYTQMMAVITQGFLYKMRCTMFNGMEDLPVKYFDTHNHGDIMSYYTNDIDALRQMISQSIPQLISCVVVSITVFCIMLYYSIWLTILVIVGTIIMFFVTKKVGGNSAGYFIRQQKSLGEVEGFAEEMMNGQKVIKVFNHEKAGEAEFDKVNEALCEDAYQANKYANMLMPILMNIGNILYVLVAIAGGIFLLGTVPNLSFSGLAFSLSITVPFLNMTRQFTGNVSQVSNQVNAVVMGLAGANRIFELMDQEKEVDDGYVTLINVVKSDNGEIVESVKQTGQWAWKHPHSDGTITYTPVQGDVHMTDVDFEYEPNKPVLRDVSVYAEPGQKVAFVGATGAGKTTITNLINRFYDIADGKIRYDSININKIKKADLRRSLGIVLQDTNLFTGNVMENIRYGKLDATDEECIAAAKLAGADDFVSRLPEGYGTMLYNNGSNLSQGQRQLIAIARAAVADPPVMIMDEATSSIDTRTEFLVQKGMDSLMEGRTVFVIAHRLSTVKNSDVIMVLDKGRIIERGNHDSLIAAHGMYYQLYTGAFELE